jgi:hypothetical protein
MCFESDIQEIELERFHLSEVQVGFGTLVGCACRTRQAFD